MNISNQEILGKTGEKIVSNYFQRQRMIVEHSIDNFDREKDLIVEGKNVEVKTMQPYVYKNAFSFKKNQLKKCKSVDRFVIVSVPPLINVKYKYGGKIFEVTSNFSYFEYVAIEQWFSYNNLGMCIAYLGYSFANIGLYMLASK